MIKSKIIALAIFIQLIGANLMISGQKFVPANHPYIQYYGRWDRSDSTNSKYSWPGVYLYAEFSGTRIGVRLKDGTNYYNLYIDGRFNSIFHPAKQTETDYILADSLSPGRHSFMLSRRNITFDEIYTFYGILLDDGGEILPPKPPLSRKIEFIGDSFTAAESNETTEQSLSWGARYPVTNIDKGFAANIAHHFNAQYMMTCRSGSGIVCDWRGDTSQSIPIRFDRVFMDSEEKKWDFKKWLPDIVVISLGLNDLSGLKDPSGKVSEKNSALFREKYHDFLGRIRNAYPGIKIVAVAAFPEWIRRNVRQVVDDEISAGKKDIFYAEFDEFPGGYVGNGHPTVDTHKKMSDQLISRMEKFHLFSLKSE